MNEIKNCDAAFLGISLGRTSYTRENFASYLAWANINTRSFACLIGDDIYALTHSVFHRCSVFKSIRIARLMGDDVSQMIERISARAGARVDIYRWRDVYRSIQYKKIISAVRDQYLGDIKFSAKVRSEVVSNLGKRFADVQDSSEQMLKRKLYRLDSYVLHEIAGLIVMSEYFGFPTEVYPGEDVKILRSIYKGEFPSLENIIPKKRVRSFCELNFE